MSTKEEQNQTKGKRIVPERLRSPRSSLVTPKMAPLRTLKKRGMQQQPYASMTDAYLIAQKIPSSQSLLWVAIQNVDFLAALGNFWRL